MIDYIFILLAIVICIQVFYFLYFFRRLNITKNQIGNNFFPDISIVICAKNEVENLKKNLPLILNQNYKSYEVIVVNDQSQDTTKYVLKDLSKKYSNLHIVHIDDNILTHTYR